MTLIKELIDIPDRVQKGDFVLRLAEDINHPERILAGQHHILQLSCSQVLDKAGLIDLDLMAEKRRPSV